MAYLLIFNKYIKNIYIKKIIVKKKGQYKLTPFSTKRNRTYSNIIIIIDLPNYCNIKSFL